MLLTQLGFLEAIVFWDWGSVVLKWKYWDLSMFIQDFNTSLEKKVHFFQYEVKL